MSVPFHITFNLRLVQFISQIKVCQPINLMSIQYTTEIELMLIILKFREDRSIMKFGFFLLYSNNVLLASGPTKLFYADGTGFQYSLNFERETFLFLFRSENLINVIDVL